MGKKAQELSPLAVGRLKAPGLWFVGGVAGLALQVTATGARTWILRVKIGAKRRDIGLGGFPDVTLATARDKARDARLKIEQGIDPIEQRKAAKQALLAARKPLPFAEAAQQYIDAQASGWKNEKHIAQWRATLETHANPVIGALDVADIELRHVLEVLEPIWTTKTETASRVRGRVEAVLDWATVRGHREGLNPARWKGHLDAILPAPGKVAKADHHAALPYAQVGAFMAELRGQEGMGAKALEFAILTAARSGEVRGATWSEISLEARTWTIPAGRMKAGREHLIPLSDAALTVLQAARQHSSGKPADLVFPGAKEGRPLSDMSLTAVLRRMDRGDITVHGFRSTFRDWAGEATAYPREVVEHALAHQIPDKAEAAYARGTLLPRRRLLMGDWAAYCAIDATRAAGDVIPIRAA